MKRVISWLLILSVLYSGTVVANPIIDKLDNRMKTNNTLVCVGLDPDPTKMPLEIMNIKGKNVEEKSLIFLKSIVDTTAPHVCAYKIQKAFFDQYNGGHKLLHDIIAYIHVTYPEIPVFVDCKIGDTDNTMLSYMDNLFGKLHADGVVINPYMGDDVFEPFMEDKNKVALVLVQTSNPKAKIIQELKLANGTQLWQQVLDFTLNRWNKNANMIPVLSSNSDHVDFKQVRKLIPQNMPILLAGVGLQGGNPQVMKDLLNDNGRGVFVNSSRGILYPYKQQDLKWRDAVLTEVIKLKDGLNQMRGNKFLLIMGPSGVGKSTVIHHLANIDQKFQYVTPLTTRNLRPGENDKISVSKQEMDKLNKEGKLVVVNEMYGIFYGTPKYLIDKSLDAGNFPILDWPIDKISVMEAAYPGRIFKVYIAPEDDKELQVRLGKDSRDTNGKRLEAGTKELEMYRQGTYDQHIDLKLVNKNGNSEEIAKIIYDAYLKSL
jgi:orotidine-5'-phosphate decarboxylase